MPARDRLKILHLVPEDGIGGVEVAAKSMRARTDLPCDFRLQFIEPPGATRRTFSGYGRVLKANLKALAAARRFEPDIILCSLWRSVPLALAFRMIHRRAKMVYFIHSNTSVHRLDALLSAIAIRKADEVWGDSAAALKDRKVPTHKSRIISFVTERAEIVERPFRGAAFVSWGRLHHYKGFDRAIRLVRLLVDRGIDARYAIHGPDCGEQAALVALAQELGIDDRVDFPGAVSHDALADVAARAAFFLQPSRLEGMCMAAVEAMQAGLVPIATAVGEMAHYVVPGETGIVIDPERLDRAATEVATMIDDPTRWHDCSLAAMRHWHDAPLYANDVCRAAAALHDKAAPALP